MITEPPYPLAVRGYRPAQVDDVVGRLQARIAELDVQLAGHRGEPSPSSGTEQSSSSGTEPSPPSGTEPDPAAHATSSGTEGKPAASGSSRAVAPPGADPLTGTPDPLRRTDLIAPALYLLAAVYLLSNLLPDVDGRYLSQGVRDHQAFEWYLGASAHNLATFSNPLFSDLQNYPDGVNLMANAAVIGLGLPLGALTVVAGPGWTFAVVVVLGLALTASGWYWVFRRYLPVHPVAAFVGGLL
ncbi:MAG: hypothetical protein ACRCY8_09770, partial [Dermatophilaceae bacterium]